MAKQSFPSGPNSWMWSDWAGKWNRKLGLTACILPSYLHTGVDRQGNLFISCSKLLSLLVIDWVQVLSRCLHPICNFRFSFPHQYSNGAIVLVWSSPSSCLASDWTLVVCCDWDVPGLHSVQGRLLPSLRGPLHLAALPQVLPLAGWGQGRLCEWLESFYSAECRINLSSLCWEGGICALLIYLIIIRTLVTFIVPDVPGCHIDLISTWQLWFH